jgi:hypothetical protein
MKIEMLEANFQAGLNQATLNVLIGHKTNRTGKVSRNNHQIMADLKNMKSS